MTIPHIYSKILMVLKGTRLCPYGLQHEQGCSKKQLLETPRLLEALKTYSWNKMNSLSEDKCTYTYI